jgi:hypothetical protein
MLNYVLFTIQTLFLEIVIYFSCSMGNLKNGNLKKYLRRLVFYFIDRRLDYTGTPGQKGQWAEK